MTHDPNPTPTHSDFHAITQSANPTREEYFELAEIDENTDGKLSAEIEAEGFPVIAEQIRNHVLALEAGRGPIPGPRQERNTV